MGTCILSKDDKNSDPEFFRVATRDEEYIENQCNFHAPSSGYLDDLCSYEHYPNGTLIYAEDEYDGLNDKEVISLKANGRIHNSKFLIQKFPVLDKMLQRKEILLQRPFISTRQIIEEFKMFYSF